MTKPERALALVLLRKLIASEQVWFNDCEGYTHTIDSVNDDGETLILSDASA